MLFVNERLDPVYTHFSFHKNHMNIFEPRDSYKISVLSSRKFLDDSKYSGPGFGINVIKEGKFCIASDKYTAKIQILEIEHENSLVVEK